MQRQGENARLNPLLLMEWLTQNILIVAVCGSCNVALYLYDTREKTK